MILIADCGGTKTDWRVIDSQHIDQFQTQGFNPYHQQEDSLYTTIAQELLPSLAGKSISQVYFYGSGLAGVSTKTSVAAQLANAFPNAQIEVNSDLLAAARALCGHDAGIACILGTGSNSCYFDGTTIQHQLPPLGYALGDEGSGAALGKQLLKDYCRGKMPTIIKERFEKRFPLSQEDILGKVYKDEKPNQFLASFSRFLLQNIGEPYIYRLVYHQIGNFFDEVLSGYTQSKTHKVHFTGSIAFYFGNIVRQVGADKGIAVGIIMETPIAGLTLFHQHLKK